MDAMEQLYQSIILDHASGKHGFGQLEDAQIKLGQSHGESFQVNPTCGDEITLEVELDDPASKDPKVVALAWHGDGCSISQASASVLHDLVSGQPLSKINELYGYFHELMDGRGHPIADDKTDALEDASAFVGTAKFPARIKCALLGWMALKDATAKALSEQNVQSAK